MLTLEEASKFHGHLGPFLVLGYRAGSYAMEKLNPSSYKEIRCIVHTPLRTPYTCFVDGIQSSTFCTLGKMNIELKDSKAIEVVFYCKEKQLRIKVKESVLERFANATLEEGSKEAEELEFSSLFEVI
ncbi:MAG: formylmethanofuran dehydrogenase subunit E family protein [Thermoproteota archaeon]